MKRIGLFASDILGKPLYPYQELAGDAIIDSIISQSGLTFTVMCARQMGKNQLSAILEAYLLFAYEDGAIVKAAPTFSPQIINSKLRLMKMLEAPLTNERVWEAYGYIIGLARCKADANEQRGPRVMFFSAGPDSNVVGATASLLLEVDEAQDVGAEKFDVQLKPMASTRNATIVLYGTAWTNDTLLARVQEQNRELEQRDGIQRNFAFDWHALAEINPHYKKFVEAEIARLGEDHVSIRTQYRLLTISGAGFLLNELQRHLISGSHTWLVEPDEDAEGYYIAGMDVGGEQRPKPGQESKPSGKRDSTVLSIARVSYSELDLPRIELVHQAWWTGMPYAEQYAATVALVEQWNIRKLVIDRTGLGDALASLLAQRFGAERVEPFYFSRPSKSKLTYQFLSMVNSARLKIYAAHDAPGTVYEECWKQLRYARYAVPGESIMTMYVNADEGHDDFLMSIALCCEAAQSATRPVQDSVIIRPRRPLYREGRF